MAWMIGSITLLVVKNDQRTGEYREALHTLKQYSDIHYFEPPFHKKLKTSLQLTFFSREISDEQVLRHFPSAVRRKVLRRLYLPSLLQTSLMQDVREQFVDAFLSACKVEIFGSGEEIVQRGSIASDLYLLVAGSAALMPLDLTRTMDSSNPQDLDERARLGTSTAGSELMTEHGGTTKLKTVEPGDFINEVGFFTETPQTDTVRTKTVCKTLTMPKSMYREIAEEHPGSVSKILKNLLTKVEGMAEKLGTRPSVALPTRIEILRAGSLYDTGIDSSESHFDSRQSTIAAVQTSAALTAIQDLIKMHMNKLKDDHTTRFLFAASRGDTATITLMCENGFDPNSSDYDMRTALMVAAFKGNTETVKKILEYQANPNLTDMHGTTALYEAARNGHESTVDVLLEHGAELCMSEGQAASTLCQIVFDGDILKLRRLMKAKIQVNAGDYDGRTAAHIAAAEGNVAALKALVEFGADLELKDRWNNSIRDEAKRANAGHVLEFLKTL
jgi:CRP-like cAMP-binding protein